MTLFLVKVKCSRYRPGVAQREGRGIALLLNDRSIRRGWVVSITPRPHFTPGKAPVSILQADAWAPGPFWTGGKSRPHRDSIPDRPARSQSPYRLSYPAHKCIYIYYLSNLSCMFRRKLNHPQGEGLSLVQNYLLNVMLFTLVTKYKICNTCVLQSYL